MKFLVILAVIGSAVARPTADGDHAPPPAPVRPGYGAPPAIVRVVEPELPPQPYNYEYGVSDQFSGSNYQHAESQDPAGTVIGSYRVNLPDGRIQTVTYHADNAGGFVADVKYEGEAIFPPEPPAKVVPAYGAPPPPAALPPRYAPAPAPRYAPSGPAPAGLLDEDN